MRRTAVLAALLWLTLPGISFAAAAAAAAGDTAAPPLPPDEVLESQGAVIGDIAVHVGDVFNPDDPEEDRRLFRLANKLHRTTRDSVILDQLLFRSGDLYSHRLLEESERILRQDRYLYDAEIRPVRYTGNRVDVEVVTRDVWTLNVGANLGRSGGVSSTGFQLQDTNLLGTGKSVTLQRSSNVDRSTSLFRYDDAAVLGSRVRLGAGYSDNSDGTLSQLQVGQPFYSLDTRWSAQLNALSADQVDTHYELGHIASGFRHQEERFEVMGGLSNGLRNGRADRWSAGFTYLRDRFSMTDRYVPTGSLPEERVLSYPWIAWERVSDKFLEARDLDQLKRTEDLHLGTQLHARLGFASSALGSTEDAAIFDATARAGWKPAADQTLLLSSDLSGRWGRDGAENVVLDGATRYYWRDWGEHLLFLTLDGAVAEHLDPELQLLLGGDNGLRGYPLRYQDGDARLLFTVEQRFFTDFYPFHLVHVGGAVFFDAGRTWGGGSSQLGLLRDVGLGLRLSSSRSGLGNVIHFDLAFPLDGDPSIKSTQWLVTTKATF
jgi:outer membrane protein assembly factor BamA